MRNSQAPLNTTPIGDASIPQLNASTSATVNVDFAQSTADSWLVSLAIAEDGNATHNAINAALAYHTAFMVEHHQKIEMSGNAAREDARLRSR
jgi:hypothetical protein